LKRKLVRADGSLAVTLPAEVVQDFKLRKGMSGRSPCILEKLAKELLTRRAKAYRALA